MSDMRAGYSPITERNMFINRITYGKILCQKEVTGNNKEVFIYLVSKQNTNMSLNAISLNIVFRVSLGNIYSV